MKTIFCTAVAITLLAGCSTAPKMDKASAVAEGTERAALITTMGKPRYTIGPTNSMEALIWVGFNLEWGGANSTTFILRDGKTVGEADFQWNVSAGQIDKKARYLMTARAPKQK